MSTTMPGAVPISSDTASRQNRGRGPIPAARGARQAIGDDPVGRAHQAEQGRHDREAPVGPTQILAVQASDSPGSRRGPRCTPNWRPRSAQHPGGCVADHQVELGGTQVEDLDGDGRIVAAQRLQCAQDLLASRGQCGMAQPLRSSGFPRVAARFDSDGGSRISTAPWCQLGRSP